MKILTVLTYYYPHWTGLTAHAVRVAEGLADRGHSVTVLTAQHDPALPLEETVNGVRIVRLETAGRFSRGMIAPRFPSVASRLIADSDVVQIHTPLPEALVVAGLCKALGTPLLMTHHGDVVMPSGALNQLLQQVAYAVLLNAGRLADGVTSYSMDYAENSRLLSHFLPKLSTIYPPVDIVEPDPEGMASWRRELGLTDKRLIGIAGRWVDEKGFDYLLRALPLIREEIPEAHVVFAGERHIAYEDTYERCRPLIEAQQEHVTFVGLLEDPQRMADFYGLCDVFALPSRTDMFALTQVEAMLCGTPVVASDIPGARVVVRETGFGRLAKPRNPRSLAESIVEVMRNPGEYAPTRGKVRQVFDTDETMADYEAALNAAIERRRHSALPGTEGGRATALSGTAAASTAAAAAAAGVSTAAGTAYVGGTEVVRYREGAAVESSLTPHDHEVLDTVLRNEADMAYRRRARILLDYLELQDGDRVLDCGCGMGFYLMAMAKLRQLELLGLDGDVQRLWWARSENVAATLIQGDIHRMPLGDGTVDKVLMSEVLEHLEDDDKALRELHRIIRPGGVLSISVPHAHYPFLWDPINRTWTGLGGEPFREGPMVGIWSNHERLYEPGELAERVAGAGFEVEVVEEATHYSFPFIHFLVYGIGKPLLENDLLPANLRSSADRFSGGDNTGSAVNPINLGVSMLRAVDQLNDQPRVAGQDTFVNVLLKARRPA